MPRRELEAVLAHEVSHVRNRDVRLMSLAAVLVGVIALVSDLVLQPHAVRRSGPGPPRRRRRQRLRPGRRARGGDPGAARRVAAPVLALAAPGVPRRRVGGRGDRRCRGHGARAQAAAGRHEGHDAHLERDGAPLHRVADEPALAPALRGPLEHPPVARVADRAAGGGRRVHDAGADRSRAGRVGRRWARTDAGSSPRPAGPHRRAPGPRLHGHVRVLRAG